MNKKEEKTLSSALIYDGKVVNLTKDEVLCPNGQKAYREVVNHRGGVCILGFLDNKVIIEKQFRYAYKEEVYELPAGKLEKDENPLEAAIREYEEETGYKPLEMISLGCMYPSCGYTNEIIYLYYAKRIEKGHRHLDDDEVIDIELMSLEEVVKLIDNNTIKDAKTICLIDRFLRLENK